MIASGEIRAYDGGFIGPEYKEQTGRIIRVGPLSAAYRTDGGEVGYLQTGDNNKLVAVSGDLPWHVSSSLKSYFKGQADHMPLDISGGTVFKMLSEREGFTSWFTSGGLLMWPLFLIGFVAMALAFERFVFLMRIRSNSDKVMADILEYVDQKDWRKCRDYCDQNERFPTCRVLRSVFEHLNVSRETMENAIQEAILRQIPRLERFVATLSVLAAIAPLLGLLGTVTGMIETFQVITLFGTGDPKLMSGGISEALVTTEVGLIVAVPIILVHHFLERRIDKILVDIEEKGNKIVVALMKKGVITEGAPAGHG
jgi:biopolymer transport protein ExbB